MIQKAIHSLRKSHIKQEKKKLDYKIRAVNRKIETNQKIYEVKQNVSFQTHSTLNNCIPHFQVEKQEDFCHFDYVFGRLLIPSLRGGGCGQTKSRSQNRTLPNFKCTNNIPENLCSDLEQQINNITDKSHLANDEQQKEDLLITFQWFTLMKEHFNNLCQNKRYAAAVYALIYKSLPSLLQSAITYLRISGYFCLQVLQIINDLLRVIFSYFMTNEDRFLKIEEKQMLMDLIQDFETQSQIEQNTWISEAEFEIEMIKAVIHSAPSNSNEGQKLLFDFMGGLAKSVLIMSPTDEFIDTLISGAQFLYKSYQIRSLKQKYEIYYYFETLKWQVINCIKNGYPVKKILQSLSEGYIKHIESQNDWILNLCWVKMIGFIIQYRPIIQKEQLGNDKLEQQKLWEYFIQRKIIQQLSFDKNQGRLLFQQFNQEDQQHINKANLKQIIQQFLFFQENLLNTLKNSNKKVYILQIKNHNEQDYQRNYLDFLFSEDPNDWLELSESNYHIDEFKDNLNREKKQLIEIIQQKNKDQQQQFKTIRTLLTKSQDDQLNGILNGLFWSTKVHYRMQLYIEKTKMIIQSIQVNEEQKQQKLEIQAKLILDIDVIQKDYNEGFLKSYNELQLNIEQILSQSIEQQLSIQKIILTKEDDKKIEQVNKQFIDSITQLINSLNNLKKSYLVIIHQIEKMKNNYQMLQKKKIPLRFTISNPYQNVYNVFNKLINQDQIKCLLEIQKKTFDNLFSNLQVVSEQNTAPGLSKLMQQLIQFKVIEQVVQIQRNYLIHESQTIDLTITFLKENALTLQTVEKVQQSQQNEVESPLNIMEKQLQSIQEFYQNDKHLIKNEVGCSSIEFQKIITHLKNDETCLKNILNLKSNDNNDIKKCLIQTTIVKKLLKQCQKTDQLNSEKQRIINMYTKLIEGLPKQQQSEQNNQNEEQENTIQLQNHNLLQIHSKFEEFLVELSQLKSKRIEQNQLLSQTTLQSTQILMKIWNLTLQYNQQEDIECLDQVKDDALKKIQLQFSVYYDQTIKYLEQMDKFTQYFQEQNDKLSNSFGNPKFLDKLLILFDQILPYDSQIIQRDNLLTKAKDTAKEAIQNVVDQLDDFHYKVRQGFVVNLLFIQSQRLEQRVIQFCQEQIVQIWATEKDERVKDILKNDEIIQMQKRLFSNDLKSFSQKLQLQMQDRLNRMNDLEQQANLEGDQKHKQELQQQLQQEHIELEEYLENINDMSSKLDISIQFLKEIRKDLSQIKQKINKLQNSLNDIGMDVRKLRGKTFYELFEIRKRKVLEQKKFKDLKTIYIQIQVQEWNPVTGERINSLQNQELQQTKLFSDNFEDQEGEVNEFLQNDLNTKDVMLIRGCAGSGKSRAAQKIEEFLWINREQKKSNWLPIYVSLPTLKEPKFNLIDEALSSEFYQFDKIQIREFKEAVASNKLQILFILDSYDEMKQDCIQSNLILTNKLFDFAEGQKLNKNERKNVKAIITTRTEILNSTSYQTWFYGESLESLKEIELLGFNAQQQDEYLKQYTFLSVKKEIYELYEFIKQITQERIDLEEFSSIWSKLNEFLIQKQGDESQNHDYIVNEEEAKQILMILKKNKCLKNISNDQIINLQKRLIELWSKNRFEQLIRNIKIEHILTTPFMMEIVVQVLPSMMSKFTDASIFKDKFIENYVEIKQSFIEQENLILKYQQMAKKAIGIEENQEQSEDKQAFQESSLVKQATNIWDQLEQQRLLVNFSFIDKIQHSVLNTFEDAQIIIKALKMKVFSIFDFYSSFIEFYHQTSIKKLQDLGKVFNIDGLIIDLFNFSQSLALDLTINELTQVKYSAKGQLTLKLLKQNIQINDEWMDTYFNDFIENGEYKKLIRSCILLTQKGSNYAFTHKSIQEFFVAKYLLSFLNSIYEFDAGDKTFKELIKSCKWQQNDLILEGEQNVYHKNLKLYLTEIIDDLYNKRKFNISLDHFQGVMSLMREEMKQDKQLKNKLIQVVQISSISEDFNRASSNSLFLLSYNNEYLGKEDFSNVNISDTSLIGLSFYKASFADSKFSNVNISSCNFNCANLTNVIWKDTFCNELPKLDSEKRTQIFFSQNGKYIIQGDGQLYNLLLFWEYKEGVQLQYESEVPRKLQIHYRSEDQSIQFQVRYESFDQQYAIHPNGYWATKVERRHCYQWNINNESENFYLLQDVIISTCAYSYDAKYLVIGGKGNLFLYSAEGSRYKILEKKITDKEYQKIDKNSSEYYSDRYSYNYKQTMFSYDNEILIASTGRFISLWKLDSDEQRVIRVQDENKIICIQIQPFSYILACGDQTKDINLFDLSSKELEQPIDRLQGHTSQVNALVFIEDGSILASGGSDFTIRLWEMRARKQIVYIKDSNDIFQLTFSPDCSILASVSNGITLWDVEAIRKLKPLEGHRSCVYEVVFSPDGQNLASRGEVVKLWDAETGQIVATFDKHTQKVNSISFSPDSQILASGSDDTTIILWSIHQREHIFVEHGNNSPVLAVQFSSDNKLLASGLKNTLIGLWKVENQTLIFITYLKGHYNQVDFLLFSPNSLYLTSKDNGGMGLYWQIASITQKSNENVQKQQLYEDIILDNQAYKRIIQPYDEKITSIAFSPDGRNLVVAFKNTKIQVFEIKESENSEENNQQEMLNKECLFEIEKPFGESKINFTLDGKFFFFIICSYPALLSIYSFEEKKLITSLDFNLDQVLSFSISPSNKAFASCGSDTTIRLWDFETWIEDFKQDPQTKSKPRCFKTIGTTSQMQSNQCLIKGAIIESNQGFNLTRLFMQKGAVDS